MRRSSTWMKRWCRYSRKRTRARPLKVTCGCKRAGHPEEAVVIYDYDPSRSGEVPARLLLGYQGYLMTDGYEGYNKLAKTEGIEHLVCWAHVRRKFVDAVKVQPKGTHGHADQAVAMIGKLYAY